MSSCASNQYFASKLLLGYHAHMSVIADNLNTSPEKATAFVTLETEADITKRRNLYYVSALIGFVWMLFHFTVVFFFTLTLGSPVLVGIFL